MKNRNYPESIESKRKAIHDLAVITNLLRRIRSQYKLNLMIPKAISDY